MKFSKTCKIAKTLAKKANRFGRDNAELVGETIYATNGKSIAMVKVQLDDDDTDGVLTAASLSEATKGSRGDASIIANGSLVVETKAGPVTMPRPVFRLRQLPQLATRRRFRPGGGNQARPRRETALRAGPITRRE